MGITEWAQLIFYVVASVAIPASLFLFKTGRAVGTRETMTDRDIRRVSDLTDRIQVEIQRNEAKGETKADAKTVAELERRVMERIVYLEGRCNDMQTHADKRFDDGSERMSKISGKITEIVDDFRNDLGDLRERMVRVEERDRHREHNGRGDG